MLLIIWDFDGTIANSERKFKNTLYDFLKYKHSSCIVNLDLLTDEFYFKNCAGKKYTEMFKVLGENNIVDPNKITEDDLNNFLKYVTDCYKLMKPNDIVFTDGMGEFMEILYSNTNISMVIATSAHMEDFIQKRRALNNITINKINAYSCCDLLDDYEHLNSNIYKIKNKPNPAIFVYALEKALSKNKNITKAIVIEDSSSGCAAGKNFKNYPFVKNNLNEVTVIGYTGGEHKPSEKELLESGADLISKNTKELFNIINKLS